MKKFFVLLFLLFFLLLIGAAVFLAAFDANRYKGMVITHLEEALGKPVDIGHVGLKWQNGIVLEISKLTVYSGPDKKSVPWIQLKNVSVYAQLLPLLQKNIQFSSILIRGGHILFKNQSGPDLEVKNLDVNIKNFSMTEPFEFNAIASLYSDKQNIRVSGKAVLGDQIQMDHLTAEIFGGSAEFSGSLTSLKTQPLLTIKGTLKDLVIDQLVKTRNPNAPQLNGHLTVSLEGQAQGLAWDSIARTLNGHARILINDGVLLNYNILKEIFDKLSVIPGVEQAIQTNFPQMYLKRTQDKSTILKPVDLNATITNGVFNFNPIDVAADFILIHGAGQAGLDGRLSIHASLILGQEISQAFVNAFSAIRLLCDNQGQMVIPVVIQGQLPQVKVIPDKDYITSRLVTGQTQEIMQGFVNDPKGGLNKIQDILKKNIKGLNI